MHFIWRVRDLNPGCCLIGHEVHYRVDIASTPVGNRALNNKYYTDVSYFVCLSPTPETGARHTEPSLRGTALTLLHYYY